MQFNGHQFLLPIKDLDDQIINRRDERGQELSEPLTVKQVIRTALTTSFRDQTEDDVVKFNNYSLAKRIFKSEPQSQIELSSEEISTIKKKVGLAWGTEVHGFVVEVLEQKNKDFKVVGKADTVQKAEAQTN